MEGDPVTVVISGRNILKQYNDLRSQGYTTVWTGEGKICMREPEHPVAPESPIGEIDVK